MNLEDWWTPAALATHRDDYIAWVGTFGTQEGETMSQARICDTCGKVEKGLIVDWIHTEPVGGRHWVGSRPEDPHDFCSRGCVVTYYTAPEVIQLAPRPYHTHAAPKEE